MTEHFEIAIIGSGPGGLSAACRAAENGVSHVLIERTDHLSDTIFKYQKGKFVMATPDILPLRSPIPFDAGAREEVLGAWDDSAAELSANVRYNAELTGVTGEKGNFELTINKTETITASNIVLAIGLQGNLRKLGIDGEDWERVQYQLDDPDEYDEETIVVVGAGDAAIENAVGLTKQNNVIIVNRRDEFARAKDGNRALIEDAIAADKIECYYNASPARLTPGELILTVPDGEATIKCDRIIARLGATPPRAFVESCGIEFPSKDRDALPALSMHYESNVPGIYIIGALGGYPLIKQAMNQGYEVVEFIGGNFVKPADEPLLEEKFGALIEKNTTDEIIDRILENVPLLHGLTVLQLREFLLDSEILFPARGDVIFEHNAYTNTFFMIVEGGVEILLDPEDPSITVPLGKGKFFGEMGLIAGRRRSATVVASEDSFIIESSRRGTIKLINSVASVEREMNRTAIVRQLRTYLSAQLSDEVLTPVLDTAELRNFKAGETLFREGDPGDGLYLLRKGSVTVSRDIGGRDVVFAYIPVGHYVGEMALLNNAPRNATIRAAIETETIWINGEHFVQMLDAAPELKREIEGKLLSRLVDSETMRGRQQSGNVIQFLIDQGMGEATDILLIDESLCVRCNNCEVACAETHGGTSRLNREAGPTYASVHVPTSCRHCEHPSCMADCPPDAINRATNGEVYINDSCIGCGNCERNCPYGVIQMAYAKPPRQRGLLASLLFGPGSDPSADSDGGGGVKFAVKCDMCKDIPGGASCVRACPTGAAIRVSPEEFFSIAQSSR